MLNITAFSGMLHLILGVQYPNNVIMTKKILRPILITLIQIVGLTIIHYLMYYFYPMYHKSVGFGLTIISTGIILIISLLIFNFYLEFKNNRPYLIGLILFIITSIFPATSFDYRPWRALFLLVLLATGFLSSILIIKLKNKGSGIRKDNLLA